MTITLYLVIQGITPSFLAPISDSLGRRPVYLFSFTLYTVASLGLVFSGSSYIALIILRALQSIGGSATLALSYAMVADYTVHSERGRFLGPMMTATNIGPSIGPVIGRGVILATGEPRWALWTLVIFGSSALLLIAFTMRETNRSIVGNGSTSPRGFWRGYWDIFIAWNKGRCDRKSIRGQNHPENSINLDEDRTLSYTDVSSTTITGKGVFKIPNPFMSLKLLFYKDAFTVLYLAASPYASWYSISSSIPLIYGTEYGFNGLLVGCCYLAGGGGILAGGLIAGKLMDWNYNFQSKWLGLEGLTPFSRSQLLYLWAMDGLFNIASTWQFPC
ncbi:hypothetical protein HYFRA_00013933 [Hymenoscyphus fraxineus]|uniref:Major facilitator superfamily (MFS) profile domain-containing protein n=1 Tax=Hymenoscyphus fraxineus TaxID=746836 RepID=A0A9N9L771_9HELO|nr:hypothetical protein HYFRA_00013933 [Hymenoscyphus fraxineus]